MSVHQFDTDMQKFGAAHGLHRQYHCRIIKMAHQLKSVDIVAAISVYPSLCPGSGMLFCSWRWYRMVLRRCSILGKFTGAALLTSCNSPVSICCPVSCVVSALRLIALFTRNTSASLWDGKWVFITFSFIFALHSHFLLRHSNDRNSFAISFWKT